MSNAAVDVALRLRLQDQATPALDKAADRAAERQRKIATETEQAARRERQSHERTSQAREVLGIRSEQRIQREIRATEAAYQRLASSGKLSAAEQARALDATRAKVTALTNEMGKLTAEQEKQAKLAKNTERGQSVLQGGAVLAAAGVAGAMALRAPVSRSMAVDERLAHLANTAFRERDVSGKRIGMDELRATVDAAVDRYGGTRDAATDALEELIASGVVGVPAAMQMLPSLVKASTASGADPALLSQIGVRAMQSFKIAPEQLPNVLNMALASGQAGGFELRDMAKWLPQQMAAATQSGMSGRAGFARLAALNQAAAITAGSKDEAGNNVVNLLGKINSADTAKDAEKMGVNLSGYLQAQRAQGVDSVTAFGQLVEQTVAEREDYKALRAQLAGAGNTEERKAALESMAAIAQGAGVGQLVQDRQALMALIGMMNNQAYMGQVLNEVRANDVGSGGAIDRNFDLMASTGSFRARRATQNVQAAQDRALGDGGAVLGALNDAVADTAAKFPVLTGATVTAGSAVSAMAGAAGLATVALGRLGGVSAAGKAGVLAGATGAIGRAAGAAAPLLTRAAPTLLRGGIAGAAAVGGGMVLDHVAGRESAVARYGGSVLSGAAVGATVGSLVPVVGTAVGAGIGAVGGALVEWLKGAPKPEPPKMQADVKVSVRDDRVVVSQQMRATGVDATMRSGTGNIMSGAPG